MVVRFTDVCLRFEGDGPAVLDGVSWSVAAGERWVVLGPNGSGKTSLTRLCAGYLHPTTGTVEILGRCLGRVDVRDLRRRIGFASGSLVRTLRPGVTALDAVLSAKNAALETWWHEYHDADRARARALLERMGCAHLADRPIGAASDGERQRVQLARTLMVEPELLLLDEPTAGLDFGGRESLVERLSDLATDHHAPPVVLVTHHAEEIPPGFTHALLLRDGHVVATGPLDETLTADAFSRCFDLRIRVEKRANRWFAFADA